MATDVLGASDQAGRGSALHHRQGPLPRRHQARRDDLHEHPAQPVCPRQHPLDRHLGGQGDARRRAGPGRRRHSLQPAADGLAGRRLVGGREQHQHAPGPRDRQRQVDRRGRRRGHRRDGRAGRRRARGDRRRLGAAAGRGRCRKGDRGRCAAAPRERPEQRRLRMDGRRQGGHRRRGRRGRGRGPPADRQPAAHPQPDGGPRRHRPVQPGHGGVHGLDVEPDAAHPAAPADRVRDRHPRAQGPLHLAGRRRRVRDEDLLLRGHGPGHARLEAHRRPPGEMGRDPAGELPEHDPRPRPHHLPGDRRHPRRRDHRAAGQDLRQPRRPPVDDRPGRPHDPVRPGPVGLLQDPQRLLRGHRGLHQHDLRGRLPRRRPARGDLRHRAGDGPVRRRDRDGSGRDPAAQLHRAGQVSLRQPVGPGHGGQRREDLHRLGQLRAGHGHGPQDGRLRLARQGQDRRPRPRQVPRRRPVDLHRGVRRRALEVDRCGRRGLGRGDVGSRPTSRST